MRSWNLRSTRTDKAIGVWPLSIAGLLVTAIYGAFLTYGLFMVALLEDFGGSRAFAAGAYSIYPIMFAVGSVLFSRMADRYPPGRVILLGATLVAVGFGLSSLATEPWQLYVFFGLVAGLGSGTLWAPPISAVLAGVGKTNKNRGLAVSLATGGMPFGVLALPPLAGFLITIYGWRLAFTALGIISFALAVPAVL
ncbi:MAG: MFS transporter, partial [Candidatus Bathyarchaeia archaeon]